MDAESSNSGFTSSALYQTRQQVIDKLLHPANQGTNSSSSSGHSRTVSRQKFWNDVDMFIEDNLLEVYEKLPSLEKQIWGKLIVMESNRRTAKAYLRHPVITIDGSDTEFDGMRLGISRFENVQRNDMVYEIFNEILKGIKLKIDPDGNIWAKRMCYSPVFLKPLYRNKPNDLFIIDQRPVRVFDIRRFKEILVYELRQPQPDRLKLEKCCMVCLKFSVDHYDLLRTPVYIIIVHLVAMELLNLVLPKDNDLSSPSSSFVAGPLTGHHHSQQSMERPEGSHRPSHPPPIPPFMKYPPNHIGGPLTPNTSGSVLSSQTRLSGRMGASGVFKRIIRKEEEQSRGFYPGGNHGRNHQNGLSNGLRGKPTNTDHDFDSPDQQRHSAAERDYASMLDLRQIASGHSQSSHGQLHPSINYPGFDSHSNLTQSQNSTNGTVPSSSANSQRVISMEQLTSVGVDKKYPFAVGVLPTHKGQGDRVPLGKKWRSIDSGIGSFGSK